MPRPFARRATLGVALAILCLGSPTLGAGAEAIAPTTHALLINGGSKPAANYQSHLHHLKEMVELLEARGLAREHISIFSADGEDAGADLAVRDVLPPQFWIIDGTSLGKRLKPRTELTDTRWDGVTLYPARRAALQEWFEAAPKRFLPGDQLLLFVTDHGERNKDDPDNGTISLWKQKLSVRDLKDLLVLLPPGLRVAMVMSQCYSGSFANAMYDGEGFAGASGDICGFFSTTRDLRAYGCYPEGRDRDRMGHAFQFIDALGRRASAADAHLDVLLADDTPDVPLRTSDVYLERLISEGAEARGLKFSGMADLLLTEAWRDRAAWEPQIRLLDRIGDTFGVFSPRSLTELEDYSQQLPDLIQQMKTYADRWKMALVSVKEENLRSFLKQSQDWNGRLRADVLKEADANTRKRLLEDLLPRLDNHAREQPDLWWRLEKLRDRAQRASQGRWRLQVRRAAILRLRASLLQIAGQTLLALGPDGLENNVAEQQTFEGLQSCEAFEPGELSASKRAAATSRPEPFPPLTDDIALLKELLPSWLGVRFGAVAKSVRAGRGLLEGASMLRAVYPDSAAAEAGLEAGDIVLGPPDREFDAPGQFREWTMTSPRGTPVPLRVLRPGDSPGEDQGFAAMLVLRAFPLKMPKLPQPPQVGEVAPTLPQGLEPAGAGSLSGLEGRPHLLFFWATWCGPCKLAVPEVMAFAGDRGIPVLAISDESPETVSGFLEKRNQAFFQLVAADPLRRSFISFGVSGTPTILLIDGTGVVRHRQVGYEAKKGLTIDGWNWSRSSEPSR